MVNILHVNTAQNVNKVSPGFHDKVKAITSRSKSLVEKHMLHFEGTVIMTVSIKRHLYRPTMLFK